MLAATALLPAIANALATIRLASGLEQPIYLVSPPDDERLFVVNETGAITVHEPSGAVIGTFLDIKSRVSTTGERGLFSVAFPPDYADTGLFYVNYTNTAGNTHISRFQLTSENDANEASEEVVLSFVQTEANHNGGRMFFGPDGMLYIATGDGGGGGDLPNNAQNLGLLLGKILRIDVSGGPGTTYTIPPDNPFLTDPLASDEIWAYGLRNPWGFTMDPETHDFYIGDVGQEAWEEVSVQPAASTGGENYGWRLMEGFHCYTPAVGCNDGSLTLPVHEYPSSGGNCAVTGGFVYRSTIAAIDGHYFFADWCSERIWSFQWDGGAGVIGLTERTAELIPETGSIDEIAGFGQDAFGNVFILDRGVGLTGEIYKIVDSTTTVDPPPAAPAISLATPNPFRSSTRFTVIGFEEESFTARIVDLAGRLVRRLAAEDSAGGELVWDGRDERGLEVAAGTYLVEVTSAERTLTRTVTRIR